MKRAKNQISKKRLSLTAIAAATLLLTTACSGGSTDSPQDGSNGPGGGALEKIQDNGVLAIGVKFDTPPYGFLPKGESEPQGFDVDITTEIAKRLGVKPKFVEANAENRIPYLQTGRIDVIAASMFHTRTRDEAIDFSITYFQDTNKFLVPADSKIKSLDDIAGETVTVTQGSTQQASIERLAPKAKVLAYQDWPATLQAMLRGEAVAVVSSTGILSGLEETANKAGEDVKIVGEGFAPSPIGIGMAEDNSDLRDAINFTLMEMYEDGTYADIYKKWWSSAFPDVYELETWPKG